MLPEEQDSLNKLKEETKKLKVECWDDMKYILGLSPEQLKDIRYKTTEDALRYTIHASVKKVQALVNKHYNNFQGG